jgi:hypothetical protein
MENQSLSPNEHQFITDHEPAPAEVIIKKPFDQRKTAGVIAGLVFLAIFGWAAYAMGMQKAQQSVPNSVVSPSPVATASVMPLTQDNEDQSASDWQKYSNDTYQFMFRYPNTWKVEEQHLKKGEIKKIEGRYDVRADKGPIDIVDIISPTMTIEVVLSNTENELGAQGPITSLDDFRVVSLAGIGRDALRSRVEDGVMPFIGGDASPEGPYPLPILFKRKPGETLKFYPQPDVQGSYVTLFDTNSPSGKSNIRISVYSKNFTTENIKAKNISTNAMIEVDQILSSFLFAEQKTKAGTGIVSGKLCYPSEYLPPGEIVAKNLVTSKTYTQNFPGIGEGTSDMYDFSLPVGKYHLRYQAHASANDKAAFLSGYYSPCATNNEYSFCQPDSNHKMIDVMVEDGKKVAGVDLCDYGTNPDQEKLLNESF